MIALAELPRPAVAPHNAACLLQSTIREQNLPANGACIWPFSKYFQTRSQTSTRQQRVVIQKTEEFAGGTSSSLHNSWTES